MNYAQCRECGKQYWNRRKCPRCGAYRPDAGKEWEAKELEARLKEAAALREGTA